MAIEYNYKGQKESASGRRTHLKDRLKDVPLKPNPAAIPPKMFLITHSLSSLSSSNISRAELMIGWARIVPFALSVNIWVEFFVEGLHIERRNRRKSLLREE